MRTPPTSAEGPQPVRPWPWRSLGRAGFLVLCLIGCRPPEERWAGARRERVFEVLGQTIAAAAPGARVLVVGNPFARLPGADPSLVSAEAEAVRGLRRGWADRAEWLGERCPELSAAARVDPGSVPLPPGATTPLSFLTERGAWDRLREAEPSATVWVSLIGVPADLLETRAWQDPAGPRWVLYLPDLRPLGGREAVRAAFQEGRLLAVVWKRPGSPPESEAPAADPREEFDRRYLLVTAATLDAVMAAWPGLFP